MADRIAVMNAGRIEQLASPTALYDHPNTRFVADFIGSTNIFDGVVATDGAGVVLPSGIVAPAAIGERPAGELVSASLRPERLSLAKPDKSDRPTWPGVVRDVQFFGGISHVMVDVDGFDRPLIVSSVGATTRQSSDQVIVWWRAEDAVAVKPEGMSE